jgi:hypothetical protein
MAAVAACCIWVTPSSADVLPSTTLAMIGVILLLTSAVHGYGSAGGADVIETLAAAAYGLLESLTMPVRAG